MQTDEGEILEEGSPKVSEVNTAVFWRNKSLRGWNGEYVEWTLTTGGISKKYLHANK